MGTNAPETAVDHAGGTPEAAAVSACEKRRKGDDVLRDNVAQGDRFANGPEDFSVGFKAGFSYFVP